MAMTPGISNRVSQDTHYLLYISYEFIPSNGVSRSFFPSVFAFDFRFRFSVIICISAIISLPDFHHHHISKHKKTAYFRAAFTKALGRLHSSATLSFSVRFGYFRSVFFCFLSFGHQGVQHSTRRHLANIDTQHIYVFRSSIQAIIADYPRLSLAIQTYIYRRFTAQGVQHTRSHLASIDIQHIYYLRPSTQATEDYMRQSSPQGPSVQGTLQPTEPKIDNGLLVTAIGTYHFHRPLCTKGLVCQK